MRGEDNRSAGGRPANLETPPRAWGRPTRCSSRVMSERNTPTCVGKTLMSNSNGLRLKKHPHVRGEDAKTNPQPLRRLETPPRAWGRRYCSRAASNARGNTPTCVGKTLLSPLSRHRHWKHPHVRGDDVSTIPRSTNAVETPPRAWGRPSSSLPSIRHCGNTPTCVGKTPTYCERARI